MRMLPILCLLALAGCAPKLATATWNPEGKVAGLREGEATLDTAKAALGPWLTLKESPARRGEVAADWAFRDTDSEYVFVHLAFGPDGKLERKAVSTATYGYP